MATDIRTSELKQPIDVAEYLFQRLKEVGVKSIHGVPGDYNLVALDYIPKLGLQWVGNCNELNAGYAADGYARVNGISALVTTFGVGELSAVNALAGAYSEYVAVVHIVGVPSTISQRDGMLLHHTLGNGDFNVFRHMSAQISIVTAALNEPAEIPALIDNAITECYRQSRPVYLMLPTDMVQKKVEGARLESNIDLNFPPNNPEKEQYVASVVLKSLHEAKSPIVLIDACAIRHRALDEVNALIRKTNLPVFVTPMGKSAIDETLPNYGGVYAGDGSDWDVRRLVESSDLVLSVGAIKSDFNTAGFTYRISALSTIDFHSYGVTVGYSEYPGVRMNGVLRKVAEHVDVGKLSILDERNRPSDAFFRGINDDSREVAADTITHAWFWHALGKWLREDDVLLTETGTANFGIWATRFPRGVTAISQVLWGSIGYATGAAQGAALAAKEKGLKRTLLFTGEGSFQLTAQEVSTMLRHELDVVVFVINNDGYTIERLIHGMDAQYNDVQPWRYTDLPRAFGAREDQAKTYQVRTRKEVEALFADSEFSGPESKGLRFVEMFMPKEDAPMALKAVAEASATVNAKTE